MGQSRAGGLISILSKFLEFLIRGHPYLRSVDRILSFSSQLSLSLYLPGPGICTSTLRLPSVLALIEYLRGLRGSINSGLGLYEPGPGLLLTFRKLLILHYYSQANTYISALGEADRLRGCHILNRIFSRRRDTLIDIENRLSVRNTKCRRLVLVRGRQVIVLVIASFGFTVPKSMGFRYGVLLLRDGQILRVVMDVSVVADTEGHCGLILFISRWHCVNSYVQALFKPYFCNNFISGMKKQVNDDAVNSFIIAIKGCNIQQIHRHLEEYDPVIVNRLEAQTRQHSLYFSARLTDPEQAFQIMKLLLEHGANPKFKDNNEQSVLFYVCRDGKKKCLQLLLSYGMELNQIDTYGQTPLYYVAKESKLNILDIFLENKVNLNFRDKIMEQTPLFYAAKEGHLEMCKKLVENGCDVTITDNEKRTAAYYAKKFGHTDTYDYLSGIQHEIKEKNKMQELLAAQESAALNEEKMKAEEKVKAKKKREQPAPNPPHAQPQPQPAHPTSQPLPPHPQSPSGQPPMIPPSMHHSMPYHMQGVMGDGYPQYPMHYPPLPPGYPYSMHLPSAPIPPMPKQDTNPNKVSTYRLYRHDPFRGIVQVTHQQFGHLINQHPSLAELMKRQEQNQYTHVQQPKPNKQVWMKSAQRVLSTCMKADVDGYFKDPVDPVKFGIDDYFDIIKEPMDFGTIKKKFLSSSYTTIDEFTKDMKLVFDNCVLYNGEQNTVAIQAIKIRGIFQENMKNNGHQV